MIPALHDLLPVPQRLALAYCPAGTREKFTVLLALDARIGAALRQTREPLIAQMRLAWWRDQLRLEADRRELSDPLATRLESLAGMRGALFTLIDGWETLLGEDLDTRTIGAFAAARAQALVALGRIANVPDLPESVRKAAERWALADLAAGLGKRSERELVLGLAAQRATDPVRLSRRMRTLAVLDGLARRSLARGGAPLLHGPASVLLAMRLGLTGL